ncbi:hypothetical protein BG004_006341 [Podila humilis]|nr:hypothetical protein BG004_006341 [Podila humilis]
MPIVTVFDIPLLQDKICASLSLADLRRCLQVSHDWHLNFAPYFFSTIILRRKGTFNKFILPTTQDTFSKYVSFIREFESYYPLVWPVVTAHQPLARLTVAKAYCHYSYRPYPWHAPCFRWSREIKNNFNRYIIALLKASPQLCTLEMSLFSNVEETTGDLVEAIQNHKHLCRIKIGHMEPITSAGLGILLWDLSHLESIAVTCRVSTYRNGNQGYYPADQLYLDDIMQTAAPSTVVKELDLSNARADVGDTNLWNFIRLCQGLMRFRPPLLYGYQSAVKLVQLPTVLPHLRDLDLKGNSRGGSLAVEHLLRASRQLERVYMPSLMHEPEILVELLCHFEHTLRKIDMTAAGTRQLTGKMIQRLLCTCPHLDEFSAMRVFDTERKHQSHSDPVLGAPDMEDEKIGTAWACTGLKVLKLRFETHYKGRFISTSVGNVRDSPIVPGALIRQLSVLTQLEDLRLGRVTVRNDPELYGGYANAPDPVHLVETSGPKDETRGINPNRTASDMVQMLGTLTRLKRLELRNMKPFLNPSAFIKAKRPWKNMEWVHYS